jgi:sulfite reductase (NADPH) hemoprotein beta-component
MTERSRNERIKEASDGLRGTIAQGLGRAITGALAEDDTQLGKFHGFYQQDDRDLRPERAARRLEPAYSFMVRLRIPGGVVTPAQWLRIDRLARDYANGQLRLTTRQTFQLHGIIKANLKTAMQAIDAAALDTIAACGDVNRNVMSAVNPWASPAHMAAFELARAISAHLLPRTGAWREIWLDGERAAGGEPEPEEPIYGRTYLPRKFKAVVAVPPVNDVDVMAHDLGFVAVLDARGRLTGWNVTVGGGMGMTHGEPQTYPRAADAMAFCRTAEAVAVAEAVVVAQRDLGDRADRRQARLKYTVDRLGLPAFKEAVEARLGKPLAAPRPMTLTHNGDRLGWYQDPEGLWHVGLFVQNGRLAGRAMDGIRAVAEVHDGPFQITPNQNLVVARVRPAAKDAIQALLDAHGLGGAVSGLRAHSLACVALPSCGLALAESERYLPQLLTRLEERLAGWGLAADAVTIRMTGCPNGCARPFLAEIGLVGRGPGRYHLYLGGGFDGRRLNKLYRRDVDEAGILAALEPLLAAWAEERLPAERFGDFVIRSGAVQPTREGRDFHLNLPAEAA